MKIRKAVKKDFDQYLRLRKEDIEEYSKIAGERIALNQESRIKKEFDGMSKSKYHLILVAEKDKQLIGYLTGSVTKNIWQHSGYIDDIFTSEKFKREGVGMCLIKTFIKFLKVKDIRKCKLEVNRKNKLAMKLYKKLGFRITSYELSLDI